MAEAELRLRPRGVEERHPAPAEGRQRERVEARGAHALVAHVDEARRRAERRASAVSSSRSVGVSSWARL